jgi:membrane protein YdbS with pleckstrin-like domain
MSDQDPRGGGDEPQWPDRDTEPIPRARFRPEPGRHAADDDGSGNPGPGNPGPGAAAAEPVGAADEPPGPEPPGPEPPPGPKPPDGPVPPPPVPEPPAGRPRPHPGPHGGRQRVPAADDTDPHLGRTLGDDDRVGNSESRGGLPPDDDDLARVGSAPRDRTASYDDDPTLFHDFPGDFDDEPGRYAGPSTVGASFVVGEPITEEELGGLRGGSTPLVTSRRVVPLEDEPSPLVQRYLFPTEKFRGEWRRHPIELAKEIGIAAGATIAVGLLAGYLARVNAADEIAGVLVLGWLGVVIWAAWQIVDWWFDRFILTNKRVMVVSGIITRNVAMMPLQRVTDMKYVQSALGRVLNYGTFELESAGQDQALRSIPHLPSPNELYLRIVEEMYEPEAVEARLAGAQDVIDDGT